MKDAYFVLYKRDRSGEQSCVHNTNPRERLEKGRMLYDKIHAFRNEERAYDFALRHLQGSPLLVQEAGTPEVESPDAKYIVAGYFPHKYFHSDYGGGRDAVSTYEVIRCGPDDLVTTIDKLAEEGVEQVRWGIELKLLNPKRHSPWLPMNAR